ncbi:MAG: hypothetical protein ACJASX_000142 [Limisphaerales bacterium]|jgi:hypothetical protein
MISDTITKIESRLNSSEAVSDKTRSELLSLLGELKSEVNTLSETHGEDAETIAGFAGISAHEATRGTQNPEALKHSIGGLEASVAEFRQSHPKLVTAVNRVCNALSNLGI